MQANTSEQLSGDCKVLPGANERIYAVGGATYRYRNYFKTLKMRWNPIESMWFGKLTSGKVWFLKTKLGLEVCEASKLKAEPVSDSLKGLVKKTCPPPIRVGKKPASAKKDDDCVTKWEYYSALPVATSRDARIHPELNINLRGCTWGSDLCQSCLECISNVQENDILPHPELGVWGDEEEQEREYAALPVQA